MEEKNVNQKGDEYFNTNLPLTAMQKELPNEQLNSTKKREIFTTKNITRTAMIAAFYVVLTLLSGHFGLGFGAVQFRLSEALTILPLFFFSAVPALVIGCLIANLFSPYILFEFIGVGASLLAGLTTYLIGRIIKSNTKLKEGIRLGLGILPPIVFNALLVPLLIILASETPPAYWFAVGFVGLGQLAVLTVLGIPLYFALKHINKKGKYF
ncbi:MAG: QueT transporter family protein [Firmicutes bacterium]|nr:QueT transporter family protein [Bacillota bacterium]